MEPGGVRGPAGGGVVPREGAWFRGRRRGFPLGDVVCRSGASEVVVSRAWRWCLLQAGSEKAQRSEARRREQEWHQAIRPPWCQGRGCPAELVRRVDREGMTGWTGQPIGVPLPSLKGRGPTGWFPAPRSSPGRESRSRRRPQCRTAIRWASWLGRSRRSPDSAWRWRSWTRATPAPSPPLEAATHGIRVEVVTLPAARRGFVLLPRRWVVERSFAWVTRFRRLARDDERLQTTLEGFHDVAFALLARKTALPLLTLR